jgi:addiction module HigA family antidote
MSLKLSKFFSTTAQSWLNMQQAYDLWKAEQKAVFRPYPTDNLFL